MIDVNEQIASVARTVGVGEVDDGPVKAVTLARTYATDIDDLWDAVTSAERIARWMTPVTGDLSLGGRYQLEGNAAGTITACDPPRGFAATWEFADAVSWIEVQLTPVDDDHTRLVLTHLARPDEHWEQFGPGATGIGWDLALLGLSLHLTTDADPPSDPMAWLGSPEGISFMTASGQAWGDADIAGGEDPATAGKAAERTFAAYTAPPDQT